jgi:hypothetical protein
VNLRIPKAIRMMKRVARTPSKRTEVAKHSKAPAILQRMSRKKQMTLAEFGSARVASVKTLSNSRRLHLPARRRRWTRQADADCGQLRARQRRCSVLHGHHLPDAGHCFFINCETTKVLGVTLIAEQSAKIFKSVGAGFERLGTGAIAKVVLLNQIRRALKHSSQPRA